MAIWVSGKSSIHCLPRVVVCAEHFWKTLHLILNLRTVEVDMFYGFICYPYVIIYLKKCGHTPYTEAKVWSWVCKKGEWWCGCHTCHPSFGSLLYLCVWQPSVHSFSHWNCWLMCMWECKLHVFISIYQCTCWSQGRHNPATGILKTGFLWGVKKEER